MTRTLLALSLLAACSPDSPAPELGSPQQARVVLADGPQVTGSVDQVVRAIGNRARQVHGAPNLPDGAWIHTPDNLRAVFTDSLVLQDTQGLDWQTELRLTGFGRGANLAAVSEPVTSAHADRVTLDRGEVVEWYVNRGASLEQGFTLERAPAGTGLVTLELSVFGDLAPAYAAGSLQLVDAAGTPRIDVDELHVFDANDTTLPAHFEIACDAPTDCAIRIAFDAEGAAWPVTVDPTYHAQLADISGVFGGIGYAGWSVDVSGDVAVVAVPLDPTIPGVAGGVAVVLTRNGALPDDWAVQQTLSEPANTYGTVVAVAGNTIAVAAPSANTVYLYEPLDIPDDPLTTAVDESCTWCLTDTLNGGGGIFGAAVDIDGDRIAVGAPEEGGAVAGGGKVYTYERQNDGSWLSIDQLVAPLAVEYMRFGATVALSGNNLAVGGPAASAPMDVSPGQIAWYVRDPLTASWSSAGILVSEALVPDRFGEALAFDGDELLVGAPAYDLPGAPDGLGLGRVSTVARSGPSAIDFTGQHIEAPPTSVEFGAFIAAENGTAAISSLEIGTTSPPGRVWLHQRNDTTFAFEPTEVMDLTDIATYPARVAMADGLMVVGRPEANATLGAVGVFRHQGDSWNISTLDQPGPGTSGARAGWAVDVHEDWLVIGQPYEDGLAIDAGQVLLLRRDGTATDGWSYSDQFVDPVPGATDQFGSAVDLNDGLLAIGAFGDDGVTTDGGSVHVFDFADPSAPLYSVDADVGGPGGLGFRVAVDAKRLIATQHLWSFTQGRVKVFEHVGGGTLVNTLTDGTDVFGMALAYNGDFLAVGAPLEDVGGADQGKVYFYDMRGSDGVFLNSRQGGFAGDEFGRSLAFVDANTVFVGAPGATFGGFTDGGAIRRYSYAASSNTFIASAPISPAAADGDGMGWSMDSDGDRLVVGALASNRVTVHERNLGGADAWDIALEPVPAGLQAAERYGRDVAISGTTIAIGSPDFDPGTGTMNGRITLVEADATLAPVSIEDDYVGLEDTEIFDSVFDNDFHPAGASLSVQSNSQPASGGLFGIDPGNGIFSWTPPANFNGQDSFTYQLTGSPIVTTVTLTVTPVNDPPDGLAESFMVDEDPVAPLVGNVLGNDSDVEGDPIQALLVTDVLNGTLNLDPISGDFTYQPDPDFWGNDSFEYQPHDGLDAGAVVTVPITVNPVNDAPVGLPPYSAVTDEDVYLAITVPGLLAGATDVEGDPITAVMISEGALGITAINPDGSYSFDPAPNANGFHTVRFGLTDGQLVTEYDLTITVTAVNDLPVGVDDAYGVNEDQPFSSPPPGVLSNDTDVEGGALTAVLATDATSGVLVLNSDGGFDYTPNPDFFGVDTFEYRPDDGIDLGPTTTVTITVSGENDPPAVPAYVGVTDEDVALNPGAPGLLAGAVDVDGDPISVLTTPVTQPSNGSLLLFANGNFSYTPNPQYNGPDSFVFEVTDGMVSVQVSANLTVNALNDAPVAVDDAYDLDEDSIVAPVAPGVVFNDTDADHQPYQLTATVAQPPTNGSLTFFNSDGAFEYVPDQDFNGQDQFIYQVEDPDGAVDQATVSLNVLPVNDAPVAFDDAYIVGPVSLVEPPATGVLANDEDVDGDPLTAAPSTMPDHGVLVLDTNGGFTYTPDPGYVGPDSFSYNVSDGILVSNEAIVALDVDASVPDTGDTGFTTGTGTGTGTGGTDTGECPTWYPDLDGDGFGDDLGAIEACDQPAGTVAEGGDCNDGDADVFPGAEEFADDGLDQDCDGEDAILEAGKGCGCSSGGGSSSWLLLALPLLALRRRQ